MANILAKIEIFRDDIWLTIDFNKLRNGDKFRITDSNNIVIIGNNGASEFIAIGDPYPYKENNGVMQINIKGDTACLIQKS